MTRLEFCATWSLILTFCAACWLLAAWLAWDVVWGVVGW